MSATWWRAIKGWLSGCVAATLAAEICLIAAAIWENYRAHVSVAVSDYLIGLGLTAPFILFAIGLFTAIPAVVVIGLSEHFRVRSLLFYVCSAGVTGGVSQVLFARSVDRVWMLVFVGGAAGLSYWYVAGRHAGLNRPAEETR